MNTAFQILCQLNDALFVCLLPYKSETQQPAATTASALGFVRDRKSDGWPPCQHLTRLLGGADDAG